MGLRLIHSVLRIMTIAHRIIIHVFHVIHIIAEILHVVIVHIVDSMMVHAWAHPHVKVLFHQIFIEFIIHRLRRAGNER